MDSCDVLIVGGGPAGSSCAWRLRNSGLDVAILDKHVFPRDKVCGGWITPGVLSELEIDPLAYGRGRVLQPITSFRTASIEGPAALTDYGKPVSYGILRREFDDYLLKRSRSRLFEGESLTSLERTGDQWIANGRIKARLVVGAGGHFCPVARLTGARMPGESAVVAQEAEVEMDGQQLAQCRVRGDTPELYFCSDMKGYGWCFRKQNALNVGLGRLDRHSLSRHVGDFLSFLKSSGRLAFDIAPALRGHAYLIYGNSSRDIAGDYFMLIGDAAGLAYPQSGEGILPAIESGLLAAETIADAKGTYRREKLESYRGRIAGRFEKSQKHWITSLGAHLAPGLMSSLARRMVGMPWFARGVILDRWFLHRNEARAS